MSQVSSNRVLRELDNRKDLPPAGHRSATAPAALQQSAVKMTTDDKWKFSPFHIFRKLIGGSTGVGHHQPSTKKDSSNQAPLRQQTAEQAAAALLRQQHQQEQNATARSLIFHMVVRAKADELATTQGNRGVDKLKLINVLWKRIESDPMLREALLRNGLLRVLLIWLTPFPDGTGQGQQVQMKVMELLKRLDPDADEAKLLGLDLAIYLLYGPRQQNRRVDDLARDLLIRWYFPDKRLDAETEIRRTQSAASFDEITAAITARFQRAGSNPPPLPETHRIYTTNFQVGANAHDFDDDSVSSASRKSSVSSQTGAASRRNTKSSPKPIPGKGDPNSGAEFDDLHIPEYLDFGEDGALREPDQAVLRAFQMFMRRNLKLCRVKLYRSVRDDVAPSAEPVRS